MSVYTDLSTDNLFVGKVNELVIDWPNLVYQSDIDNLGLLNTYSTINIGEGEKSVSLKKPADLVSSYDIVLPPAQGGANTILCNDGSGNLSWVEKPQSGYAESVITVSSDTVLVEGNNNVKVDASSNNVTVTLPVVDKYTEFFVVISDITDGNSVTVGAEGGQTFDSETKTEFVLTKKHQKIQVKNIGGTIWYTV